MQNSNVEYELQIFLKNKKKPLPSIYCKKHHIDEFLKQLNNNTFIQISSIIIQSKEVSYAIYRQI